MKAGHKWTYAWIVVDYRPQKEDSNWIRIAVGGNLITYKGGTSTCTVDLTTSKLLWNSILSTEGARYMCLDLKNFYLTAALDHNEYMKIPLALFPEWTKKQYNLNTYTRGGFVFWRYDAQCEDSLKQVFWQINSSENGLLPMDITNV